MKLIVRCMRDHLGRIGLSMTAKLLAAAGELMIPYVLEYMIDWIVPRNELRLVILYGLGMAAIALAVRQINIFANQTAVSVSRDCTQKLRQDLFVRTTRLSGTQADAFGLPSLISRMTSDSYNIQNFITSIQTVGIRAPITLVGGILITWTMDPVLASILCVMAPILICVVVLVSFRGIPLYDQVQRRLDTMVRVLRENITGIRVVKALSKTDWERRRFQDINDQLTDSDLKAGVVMAIPSPMVQMCLNLGLILVVLVGAHRVDSGAARPGVILAFLTYFNMILQRVMSLNRIFMLLSKASASADRIEQVLSTPDDQPVFPLTPERQTHSGAFLEFDHVSFTHASAHGKEEQQSKCLDNISFQLNRGETLGIIGATGAGKTTLLHLLMRFYDADEGSIYVDGRDVRCYDKTELRQKFGVAFQNDIIFAETLEDNISLGRPLSHEEVRRAAQAAMAAGFIQDKPEQYQFRADIKGANLSGGQKQRILIARAFASRPEILILDDSASALDYQTDANLRQSLRQNYAGVTSVIVAQRVSSIMGATKILVLEDGRRIGLGTHQELLEHCPTYLDIYQSQMGALL